MITHLMFFCQQELCQKAFRYSFVEDPGPARIKIYCPKCGNLLAEILNPFYVVPITTGPSEIPDPISLSSFPEFVAWLVESETGNVTALRFGKYVLGRGGVSSGQRIAINNSDIRISREHCIIDISFSDKHGCVFQIQDLNSRNGTFINKQRLEGEDTFLLKSRQQLKLGTTEFKFASFPEVKGIEELTEWLLSNQI